MNHDKQFWEHSDRDCKNCQHYEQERRSLIEQLKQTRARLDFLYSMMQPRRQATLEVSENTEENLPCRWFLPQDCIYAVEINAEAAVEATLRQERRIHE